MLFFTKECNLYNGVDYRNREKYEFTYVVMPTYNDAVSDYRSTSSHIRDNSFILISILPLSADSTNSNESVLTLYIVLYGRRSYELLKARVLLHEHKFAMKLTKCGKNLWNIYENTSITIWMQ